MRGIQTAIRTGKPLVDADLMGRAYPNLWQVTPNNAGISLAPAAASDAKGNTLVHVHANTNRDVEDILRAICVKMGQAAGISLGALTGHQVKHHAAQRSISLAWYLGRAVHLARSEKRDIADSILSTYPGKRILTGKIIRVTRDVRGAFTEGSLEIVPFATTTPESIATSGTTLPSSQARRIKITFQNENIHAFDTENRVTLASVPDLIIVLDAEDGRALGTQDYRYGLRVHVIALVGSPQWTEGEGLRNGGPEAFGYVCLEPLYCVFPHLRPGFNPLFLPSLKALLCIFYFPSFHRPFIYTSWLRLRTPINQCIDSILHTSLRQSSGNLCRSYKSSTRVN